MRVLPELNKVNIVKGVLCVGQRLKGQCSIWYIILLHHCATTIDEVNVYNVQSGTNRGGVVQCDYLINNERRQIETYIRDIQ